MPIGATSSSVGGSVDNASYQDDRITSSLIETRSSSNSQENTRIQNQQVSQELLNEKSQDTDENIWSPQSNDELPLRESSNGDNNNGNSNSNRININKDREHFEWTPYAELHLLNSLRGLRPVGANFHFYIHAVHNRFNAAMGSEIPRIELINKLYSYYNFDEALKISGEDLPTNTLPFSLPKDQFPECSDVAKYHKSHSHRSFD